MINIATEEQEIVREQQRVNVDVCDSQFFNNVSKINSTQVILIIIMIIASRDDDGGWYDH